MQNEYAIPEVEQDQEEEENDLYEEDGEGEGVYIQGDDITPRKPTVIEVEITHTYRQQRIVDKDNNQQ